MTELYDLAVYGAEIVGGYFGLLITGGIIENFFSQRLYDEGELEEVTREETERIWMGNGRLVVPIYVEEGAPLYETLRRKGARSKVIGFDTETDEFLPPERIDNERVVDMGVLEIPAGWRASRGTVKHELYHLKRHLPRSRNRLVRLLKWFYQEPAATLYSTTGVETI